MSGNFVQRGDCAIEDKWAPNPFSSGGRRGPGAGTAHGVGLRLGGNGSPGANVYPAPREPRRFPLAVRAQGHRGPGGPVPLCGQRAVPGGTLRRFLEQGLPFAACRQAAADTLLGQDVAACLTRPNDNLP